MPIQFSICQQVLSHQEESWRLIEDASCSSTTTMSNFPMPNPIPPSSQQVAGVLQSALRASQELLQSSPANLEPLRSTFLQFYASQTFQLILGISTQHHTTIPSDN